MVKPQLNPTAVKMIINNQQIENATCRIQCGNEKATAFFVSEHLLLTAYHAVIEFEAQVSEVYIDEKNGVQNRCEIVATFPDFDLCILSTSTSSANILPLQATEMKVGERCSVFGFPYRGSADDITLSGKINKTLTNERDDFVIGDIDIEGNFDYGGLSGSPVVIHGYVAGIILRQVDQKLSAISIVKLNDVLIVEGIAVKEEYNFQQVPREFHESVSTATPNFSVIDKIQESLYQKNSWILIQGSPGSGKSTLLAGFWPWEKRHVICGKYFVKVPNDRSPVTLRISPEFFLEWVEDLVSRTIAGQPHAKSESAFEKRIARIAEYFENLNAYYKQKDQIGIIIVDGLDEVEDLKRFLACLPNFQPSNLKIILSHVHADIPSNVRALIAPGEIIFVTPIDPGQCEAFIAAQIGLDILAPIQIQRLASKSEGHPLYLRYLVNYILQNRAASSQQDFNSWIDNIPFIAGDIAIYYESIWENFFRIPDKLWILIILSKVRQPILKSTLIELLPEQFRLTFSSHFSSIRYLLNGLELLEIYHTSFKDFIAEKTLEQSTFSHDLIVKFFERYPSDIFTITNTIFHQIKGSQPLNAIKECDQSWANECAQHHVIPDLVLLDIKEAIQKATSLALAPEVIRLLLLLERVTYRYDKVFFENSIQLAQTLIAQGNYDAAIRYLVRNDTLQVTGEEATSFLRLLYEYDAIEQAQILQTAIHAHFRLQSAEQLQAENGISFELLRMELLTHSLSMNVDPNRGKENFYALLKKIRIARKDEESKGDRRAAEQITSFITSVLAWQNAYVLIRFGIYSNAETMAKNAGREIDKKWTELIANILLNVRDLQDYRTGRIVKDDPYNSLVKDIEYLVSEYGFENEDLVIKKIFLALYEDSKNPDILLRLTNDYVFEDQKNSLRAENKVDLDYFAFQNIYFKSMVEGYSDTSNQYPQFGHPIKSRHEEWEEWLIALTEKVGFIEGKVNRTVTGNSDSEEKVIKELLATLKQINFTFDERSYWVRAYHLPEDILPLLYQKIAGLLIRFSPGHVSILLDHIYLRSSFQLGLYTEGYRECLYELAKTLIEYDYDASAIVKLLTLWREHTLQGVANRWERTPELLRISELFALAGSEQDAEHTITYMLETSMGPHWYKDAQFDLINITLCLPLSGHDKSRLFKNAAGLLDQASGEMTFQNYIRYDKQSFVGTLVKQQQLPVAIAYFQQELLPEPLVLIDNAENPKIDMPRKGDGYHPGARNISEQGGLIELLQQVDQVSPYLTWALAEVLAVNDDTFRYSNQYAKLFACLLNDVEQSSSIHIADLCAAVATLANSAEMNEPHVRFVEEFEENLTESNVKMLQKAFKAVGLDRSLTKTNQRKATAYEDQDHLINLFNESVARESGAKRLTRIQQGLDAFQKSNTNLFDGGSAAARIGRENLKSLFASDAEAVRSLGPFITKIEREPWVLAAKIIWYLDDKLNPEKSVQINEVVLDHFRYIIHPVSAGMEKYSWINNTAAIEVNNNAQLTYLFMWMLVYPVKLIRDRAFLSLKKLINFEPDLILTELIRETLAEGLRLPAEQCVHVMDDIADEKPYLLINYFRSNPETLDQFRRLRHFSISKTYLDISIKLNRYGYTELYAIIKALFPSSIIVTGEVVLEESYLRPIAESLDALNDLGILNKDFCEQLLRNVKKYCEPASIKEYKISDQYLKRSFYDEDHYEGRFPQVLKYALNMAIMPRVEYNQISTVYEMING